MVRYIPDKAGRFTLRPHFDSIEIDHECETIVTAFLVSRYNEAAFPISTDDLTRLIERDTDDLDLYADLSSWGPDVEGLTEFRLGHRPRVYISARLSESRSDNRLRTTLCHEYGHVHYHDPLWQMHFQETADSTPRESEQQICLRDAILDASQVDWMEWQAGYVCGAMLMPISLVQKLAGEYADEIGLPDGQHIPDQLSPGLIDAIRAKFQVSAEAARIRLIKLDILPPTPR